MSELQYQRGEIRWVSILDKDKAVKYLVTSKPDRSRYFLYEVKHGEFIRLGSGPDPQKLEDKFVDWASSCQGVESESETEDELEL